MDLERRQSDRISTNRIATIRTEDGLIDEPCIVCNLSEGGAKLVFEEPKKLPTEFILFLRQGSTLGRRCQTIWHVGNKVGVRFVSVLTQDTHLHKGSGVWAPE
jgi:hypothetical protein